MAIASFSPQYASATGIPVPTDTLNKETSSISISEATDDKENFLVVSPYDERPHLLDLRTVDISCQLLARALVGMKALRIDYATAPYASTFNFSEIVNAVRSLAANSNYEWKESHFYIVVFRSQIPPTTVYADLGVLDKAAHEEATKSGGFLKYWFGTPDSDGRNLATCVWRSSIDARNGSVGATHRKAAGATRFLYKEWAIERLRLVIKDGAEEWEITQWTD